MLLRFLTPGDCNCCILFQTLPADDDATPLPIDLFAGWRAQRFTEVLLTNCYVKALGDYIVVRDMI